MKIVGITKVRNEQEIIQDTLDYYSFCDALYVYDDCSTDHTVNICKSHKKVKAVVQGTHWDLDRYRAEYQTRQRIFEEALKDNPEWVIYFDADERIEWDFKGYENYDCIVMKLFDFYITEDDKNHPYYDRQWLGPEYRNILMMFRNMPGIGYFMPDQREALLRRDAKVLHTGYVKHYGKAISIDEWEKTCDYYSSYFDEPYRTKWLKRKGKAVHSQSDFGRPLIRWDEKELRGVNIG
jgi:hypothetical protein